MKIDIYYHLHGEKDEIVLEEVKEELRPMVRGEWVPHDNSAEHTCCSSCRKVWNNVFQPRLWSFCPSCGADMRGTIEGFVPLDNAKLEDTDFSLADRIREEGTR